MSKEIEEAIPIIRRWGRFRYSVVSRLVILRLSRGELAKELRALAEQEWDHPITAEKVRFAFSTIEGWYYKTKDEHNPIDVLTRKIRKDRGTFRAITPELAKLIRRFHKGQRKTWSHQLHCDNIRAYVEEHPELNPVPSYATLRRYRNGKGMFKVKRSRNDRRPGAQRAAERLEQREVRSFEKDHVNELLHLDFHNCSREVLTREGQRCYPVLLGIMDDRSRRILHMQWYLQETAENLIHGLIQAFLKHGLPRAILHDNGSAMKAAEFLLGLDRLSIKSDPTLEYSPWQNGKLETFWAPVEGRLMAMLVNCKEITMEFLNEATLVWEDRDYNDKLHSETGETPLKRFLDDINVGRPCPPLEDLRNRFGRTQKRRVRRSDGTVSIKKTRFEIPSQYRHLREVSVRYAEWDLSNVHLQDQHTGQLLCRIFPLDKSKNADGRRRMLRPIVGNGQQDFADTTKVDDLDDGPAPLLKKLMRQHAQTGLPPAYIPKDD